MRTALQALERATIATLLCQALACGGVTPEPTPAVAPSATAPSPAASASAPTLASASAATPERPAPKALERPASFAARYVYPLRDKNIPDGSSLTVDADAVALVLRGRKVLVTLGPGRHTLGAASNQALGAALDGATGLLEVEILFVKTTPIRDTPIVSPTDTLRDPVLSSDVTPRLVGKVGFQVSNPVAMFETLLGTDLDVSNEAFAEIVGGRVGGMGRRVARAVGLKHKKSFLELPTMAKELSAAMLEDSTIGEHWEGPHQLPGFASFGLKLLTLDVTLELSDADRKVLQQQRKQGKK